MRRLPRSLGPLPSPRCWEQRHDSRRKRRHASARPIGTARPFLRSWGSARQSRADDSEDLGRSRRGNAARARHHPTGESAHDSGAGGYRRFRPSRRWRRPGGHSADEMRIPTAARPRRHERRRESKRPVGLEADGRPNHAAGMRPAGSPSRCKSVFRPESVWGLSKHSIGEGLHTDSGRNTDGEGERRCVAPPGGPVCPRA